MALTGDTSATFRRPFNDDLATFGRRSGAPESRAERAFCLRVADREAPAGPAGADGSPRAAHAVLLLVRPGLLDPPGGTAAHFVLVPVRPASAVPFTQGPAERATGDAGMSGTEESM